jgi:hypothetical protein
MQGGAVNENLRRRLLALIEHDDDVRERLAASGDLFDGYHPGMQSVHDANADALEAIIAADGWPDAAVAGEDGAEAAWRIVQHAIAKPEIMRRSLTLIEQAVARGAAPAWQLAYLIDRIRTLEGRPQVYGTQFDWDEEGRMSPEPIEAEGDVDARRASAGLPPLAETAARIRAESLSETRPPDIAARRRQMHEWAIAVGWRDAPSS